MMFAQSSHAILNHAKYSIAMHTQFGAQSTRSAPTRAFQATPNATSTSKLKAKSNTH